MWRERKNGNGRGSCTSFSLTMLLTVMATGKSQEKIIARGRIQSRAPTNLEGESEEEEEAEREGRERGREGEREGREGERWRRLKLTYKSSW